MPVRLAREDELEEVNRLRKQVNDVHVKGKPDVFVEGFSDELRDLVYEIMRDPEKELIVDEREGELVGFAVLHHVVRPENPFMKVRDFLDVDEFCVDEGHRRQGVGAEMIAYIKEFAAAAGFKKIELNVWEFNSSAVEFYEALGFTTYRRYMEMFI